MKLTSIPNNDSSTQVKDEEIYAAMNAMCEIFGETNPNEEVVLQSQIDEQNVIPISSTVAASCIHHSHIDETLNLTHQVYTTAQSDDSVKDIEVEKQISETGKPSKRKKQKSLVSRADLDKYLEEKKSKKKTQKLDQRKRKKLTDPTQCLHCGKTFSIGYMESHIRTHSGYVKTKFSHQRSDYIFLLPFQWASISLQQMWLKVFSTGKFGITYESTQRVSKFSF